MKFGKIEYCKLRAAHFSKKCYSEADHHGQCNYALCEACGPTHTRAWFNAQRRKGLIIQEPTYELLLPWPNLPIHSNSEAGLNMFLDATESIPKWLNDNFVGENRVYGYVGGCEYNAPPKGGDAKVQPHIHLALLMSPDIAKTVIVSISNYWELLGGEKVKYCIKRDDEYENPFVNEIADVDIRPINSLKGIIKYLGKDSVEGFSTIQRLKLHRRVFNWVERHRKKSAIIRFIGGPALSGHGHRKLRARIQEVNNKHVPLEARQYSNHLPLVKNVCLVEPCPSCEAMGTGETRRNGYTANGKPRWHCIKCGNNWLEHREYGQYKYLEGIRLTKTQVKKIHKYNSQGMSERKIADKLNIARQTIHKALTLYTVVQSNITMKPNSTPIEKKSRKILLIDADSKIPNLALMKLSAYHKSLGDIVELVCLEMPYYPNRKKREYIAPSGYDIIYCSVIFNGNKEHIVGDNIIFGGTGHDLKTVLPKDVENIQPDYSIYPDNDTSYGFLTRGCIRKCYFCKVPEKEGYIHRADTVEKIVSHKKVKFMDNNILAHPDHKEILKELVELKIKCQFNQGLDIRLIDAENSKLLSELNYLGEYIFAFDDIKYKALIDKKLKLLFVQYRSKSVPPVCHIVNHIVC